MSKAICQVDTGTDSLFREAIVERAKKLGFQLYTPDSLNFQWLYFYRDFDICGDSKKDTTTRVVTLSELFPFLESLCAVEKVKLNEEYSAEVTKNGITVGCQTFSFEVFDELALAVAKMRAKP